MILLSVFSIKYNKSLVNDKVVSFEPSSLKECLNSLRRREQKISERSIRDTDPR